MPPINDLEQLDSMLSIKVDHDSKTTCDARLLFYNFA